MSHLGRNNGVKIIIDIQSLFSIGHQTELNQVEVLQHKYKGEAKKVQISAGYYADRFQYLKAEPYDTDLVNLDLSIKNHDDASGESYNNKVQVNRYSMDNFDVQVTAEFFESFIFFKQKLPYKHPGKSLDTHAVHKLVMERGMKKEHWGKQFAYLSEQSKQDAQSK